MHQREGKLSLFLLLARYCQLFPKHSLTKGHMSSFGGPVQGWGCSKRKSVGSSQSQLPGKFPLLPAIAWPQKPLLSSSSMVCLLHPFLPLGVCYFGNVISYMTTECPVMVSRTSCLFLFTQKYVPAWEVSSHKAHRITALLQRPTYG